MKTTLFYNLLFLVILSQVFAGCGSMVSNMAESRTNVESGAIPQNFGQNVDVLLCVLHDRRSFDKYLEEHVRNEYKGEYELIMEEDLNNEKFSDLDKYRYAFRVNRETRMVTTYNAQTNRHQNSTKTTYTYYVEDRKENKIYASPMTSGYFSRMIETYMQNLEAERRKYNR